VTGTELKTWREQAGLSPLAAAELLGIELWQLAGYKGDNIPVPRYVARLVHELAAKRRTDAT
jgi:hypothetical protein